jgi:hypothetical protein
MLLLAAVIGLGFQLLQYEVIFRISSAWLVIKVSNLSTILDSRLIIAGPDAGAGALTTAGAATATGALQSRQPSLDASS